MGSKVPTRMPRERKERKELAGVQNGLTPGWCERQRRPLDLSENTLIGRASGGLLVYTLRSFADSPRPISRSTAPPTPERAAADHLVRERLAPNHGQGNPLRRARARRDPQGRQRAHRRSESHARPQGPQRGDRECLRSADHYQGRRDGCEVHRAARPVRERRCADGEGGRVPHLRHRGRRHHHRDRARPGYLSRRLQARRGGP